jgi:subtilase family serine protease
VSVLGPDLVVANVVSTDRPVSGSSVRVTATVKNAGTGHAPASKTELLLDGWNALGVVDTPALAPGQSATVSVLWDVKGVSGQHSLRATVDKTALAAEEAESNNSAHRLVTVKSNRVTNGAFAQG